ncbi:MAG TPA: peptidoglycan-associated lipoprotein Pal [Burkholderiaceae bacterium]|nr:peptidoglycan-associated lipoprotein Pal [Burkholderiaceae bacterium]
MTRQLSFAGFMALLPFMFAACSSTPLRETSAPTTGNAGIPSPGAPSGRASAAAPSPAAAPTASRASSLPAHLDPASPIFRERSVYFDFDETVIKPEWRPVIERQGQYLAQHHDLKVRVEGNTDERGGSEYNLALGQRRAEAVKKDLLLYGVNDSQVETVSFGKERPKASGHDETDWAENRRADIVYARASQ